MRGLAAASGLGLAVHGLHYALVGVGFLVVAALVWAGRPRRGGRRGGAAEDPRVAALREAARTGRLGDPGSGRSKGAYTSGPDGELGSGPDGPPPLG